MNNTCNLNQVAIVCREVATEKAAILYAERSNPEDEADSGWQFLCGKGNEEWSAAQIWSVGEVLKHEPSLEAFIAFPTGTILSRNSPQAAWIVNTLADN